MMEIARIVSGKRGWVTRGLREYVGKGEIPFVCWGDLSAMRFPVPAIQEFSHNIEVCLSY